MMRLYLLLILIIVFLIVGCSNEKNKVVEYGDYKCPYCKKVETDIMPKLQKDYIDKEKIDYQFVNMAFLGEDSIIGSRAGHAVKNIAPSKYLKFQKLMFSKQPNHENKWITHKLIDNQIDKLNLSKSKTNEVKRDYKTKNSQSWKDAQKDVKRYKDKSVKEAPTVYVNGKKLKNPYNYKEYKKYLK
ncbi:DsbA family protein [Staphylococcus epidermidis]|nr:DsbA family protein [Staphylococcus epidermidis]MCG1063153.1 DsbA family protein [Staphylococcus epidermidis]MCG2017770.1 DsbA family protein [Staphylococcus epidermidis]MCG2029103.1 DsbA family protein [Staphylococcus epidermidis]MCG2121568.1 DsbA family protein [Staphylococcus epidermidis]MCG2277333.1 DsbA family protein [Staphylococcus epidermidis]